MSHEHHRRERHPIIAIWPMLAVAVGFIAVGVVIYRGEQVGNAILKARRERVAALLAYNASLGDRIDAIERHVAELAKMSHERRSLLAAELRKEMAGAGAAIESRLAQEKVSRGSQLNAERVERRNAIASLEDAAASNAQMILREMQLREEAARSVAARLAAAEGRLKALESRPSPRLYTDGCRYWLAP